MIDIYIYEFMKLIENEILTKISYLFSTIGSVYGVGFILCIFLLLKKDIKIISATTVLFVFNNLIKIFIQRLRPESEFLTLNSYSFPSGHAMIGTFIFGYIAYCFFKVNKIISGISIFFIIMISFSRVYLKVHFLSDVIVGIFLGLLFLVWYIYITEKS